MRAQSPLLIRNWSTSDARSQRYDYYAHALATAIFPIQLSGSAPSAFGVDMSAGRPGRQDSHPPARNLHRCFADRGNIARAEGRTFHLLTSTRSAWTLEHRRENVWGPATSSCATVYSVQSEIGNDFNIVHVALSEAWIQQAPAPSVLVGARIDANDSWGRALSAFPTESGTCTARRLSAATVIHWRPHRIAAGVPCAKQERSSIEASQTERAAVLDRIRDCMAGQSREATLCAADVVAAVSIRSAVSIATSQDRPRRLEPY
jgi:hypothetical protein